MKDKSLSLCKKMGKKNKKVHLQQMHGLWDQRQAGVREGGEPKDQL